MVPVAEGKKQLLPQSQKELREAWLLLPTHHNPTRVTDPTPEPKIILYLPTKILKRV